jgi:FKBP-type peptidyl-prolyl cis-trans isomerase
VEKRTTYLILMAALIAMAVGISGCSGASKTSTPAATMPGSGPATVGTAPVAASRMTTIPPSPGKTAPVTTLEVQDVVVGTGPAIKSGDIATVDYAGWLTDGKVFDSSVNSSQPFQFTVGQGQVISGWDKGVAGMKVGGVRKLTIPPDMAYGATGAGDAIPPGATLVFLVKLVQVN